MSALSAVSKMSVICSIQQLRHNGDYNKQFV